MKFMIAVGSMLVALATGVAGAQRSDTLPSARLLPADVEREAVDAFNADEVLRATGPLSIEADRTVSGDVAVLNGPVIVAGRISGRLVAINANVRLLAGARVEGEILVLGGRLDGRDSAFVGGDVRVYRPPLAYRMDEGKLVALSPSEEDQRWWVRRWQSRSRTDLLLATARSYNRVEGLPIQVGPTLRRNFQWGRVTVDALGVFRTSEKLTWNGENVGHSVRAAVEFGGRRGITIGGELHDVVDEAEPWQLSDSEVGLASFFLHRDYRDYYARHGGGGTVTARFTPQLSASVGLHDEIWAARPTRDPFTLFRNSANWRPNPLMDEGRFHITTAGITFDSRNDDLSPWSGWYFSAEFERGSGRLSRVGATSSGVRDAIAGDVVQYGRGFLDVRRYNRLSPDGQLNFRLLAGGWLSGDDLPLQRRFSLSGPGAIPGYDFRQGVDGTDVLQCGGADAPAGAPAECERMLLAQVEFRSDLRADLLRGLNGWSRDGWGRDAQWVVFGDLGRGWLVGPREGRRQYPSGALPSLDSFKSDAGAGIDLGLVGLFVAKSVSDWGQPANFLVRIRQRF